MLGANLTGKAERLGHLALAIAMVHLSLMPVALV